MLLLQPVSRWRKDGVGRWSNHAFAGCEQDNVIGVDQILDGFECEGSVLIYDDDHYYIGSAIALRLSAQGVRVTMVTPESELAGWSQHTEEHSLTMKALIDSGVELVTAKGLVGYAPKTVQLECVYSGVRTEVSADYLLPISARVANDGLWRELEMRRDEFDSRGGLSIQRVGDCRAPGIVAAAVYAGHKAARELGSSEVNCKRDRVVI